MPLVAKTTRTCDANLREPHKNKSGMITIGVYRTVQQAANGLIDKFRHRCAAHMGQAPKWPLHR